MPRPPNSRPRNTARRGNCPECEATDSKNLPVKPAFPNRQSVSRFFQHQVSDLGQRRGLGLAQSPMVRSIAPLQGQDIRPWRRGGFFPLTPALSRRERVKSALAGAQTSLVGFPLREARCSLSLRERVRVRGNGANCRHARWTNPELSNSTILPSEPDVSSNDL